jgi:hypothetical protein
MWIQSTGGVGDRVGYCQRFDCPWNCGDKLIRRNGLAFKPLEMRAKIEDFKVLELPLHDKRP